MARVRQARRCRARRSNGKPCRAWAITGGFVCRVHGGSARQVRREARIRAVETSLRRAFHVEYTRWLRERAAWQAQRILVTAELLGIPPRDVRPVDIAFCTVWHGRPDGLEAEPKMRGLDRRYGPRTRTAVKGNRS
jgi:hypothetical protein